VKQSVSIVVDPRDRRAPLDGLVRSQEAVFLDARGCPVCEYCGDAEEQFFRWFASRRSPTRRCTRACGAQRGSAPGTNDVR
jgi:hypothetical protein